MNPININRAKPSHTAAANPPAGNAVPSQANPIAPQAGSLNSQQGSGKKERSIQSSSPQTSPRASEKKLNEGPMTLDQALNIENPKKRDAALLEIAKDGKTTYDQRNAAIEALSTQARDKMFLEIAKDPNTHGIEREMAIQALSTQEKRDEAWIARATNPNIYSDDRIGATLNISDESSSIKDALLLEIAKDLNISNLDREVVIQALSSQKKRDEAWIARATNRNIDPGDRIGAIINISDRGSSIRDAMDVVLLEVAKITTQPYYQIEVAIQGLSSQEKRDEVWIARATDLNLDIIDRIDAAINISTADNTILRNKVLIELYNEALNQGQGEARLERIVDAIQDPELQAVAREALEAGGPVRLGSTKSARNIRE